MSAPAAEHNPLESDSTPTRHASQASIEADAAAALRYLRRRGAEDLAGMLGIEGAA